MNNATQQASRWQLRDHERNARERSALTQSLLGRHASAIAAQQALVSDLSGANDCSRADRFETLFWLILVSEPEPGNPLVARAWQAEHDAATALRSCTAPRKRRNHLVNVALFALQQGDRAEAAA